MAKDIKRHSYTKHTGQSYINSHGVPCRILQHQAPMKNYTDNRTIIRTNHSVNTPVPANQIEHFTLFGQRAPPPPKSCGCDD